MCALGRIEVGRKLVGCGAVALSVIGLAGCTNGTPGGQASTGRTNTARTTTTCPLSDASSTVPVSEVCSASGTPHFATPDSAMVYLSAAWNSGNVQKLDYVTDPAGRQQMNSMAAQMVNLRFKYCSANPTGDYTCFFSHDIAPSDSSTTYPNPMNYPPGEAVFTVAPAATPGWYLTDVVHCG
jgi:hypothetical protein